MDSIRVSEAPDPGSIPGEATLKPATTAGFIIHQRFALILDEVENLVVWDKVENLRNCD